MDDDTMIPRDRINENMLQRMLDSAQGSGAEHCAPEGSAHKNEKPHATWGLENDPLASVYAPLQAFRDLYDRETALHKGTVFSELDLPFMGQTVTKGGTCRG